MLPQFAGGFISPNPSLITRQPPCFATQVRKPARPQRDVSPDGLRGDGIHAGICYLGIEAYMRLHSRRPVLYSERSLKH